MKPLYSTEISDVRHKVGGISGALETVADLLRIGAPDLDSVKKLVDLSLQNLSEVTNELDSWKEKKS